MTTAHMIHGFLGVGKTTFSKKLQRDLKSVRFTPDEWMVTLYGHNPPEKLFSVYESKITFLMWGMIEQVLAAGVDVILDFGFWNKKERIETRKKLEAMGADVKIYNLQCPDSLSIERVLKRTGDLPQGALFIDQSAINTLRRRYEPIDPRLEESILIVTG